MLTPDQKLDVLWETYQKQQGVLSFLRIAQILAAIAVAGLTLVTLIR